MLASLHYGLLVVFTTLHAKSARVGIRSTFGPWPTSPHWFRLALIGIPMVGLAFLSIYVVYAPLSLLWPEAIHAWLFEDLPVLYQAGDPYPLVTNVMGIAMLTVVAPLVEEWFFRGLLLRRWTRKWGVVGGVIGSSLVFAVLHVDVLGAFLFGVVMCGLYARYRSLWPAVIVHVANNALAAGALVLGAHGVLDVETMSAEQLRAAWWMPLFGAFVAVPWALRVRRSWEPMRSWQFGPSADAPRETCDTAVA